jgi:hypothetical protein
VVVDNFVEEVVVEVGNFEADLGILGDFDIPFVVDYL